MRVLKKLLVGIGIVLIVLIVVVVMFLGQVIKAGVETVGPQVAGVDMTLEKASVNLLAGNIHLKGLVIGNPEGFKTPSAMELGQFVIDLDMASLLSDTIVVKQIHIDGPQVTYEQGLTGNNLGRLMKNLEGDKPKEEKPKEEKPEKPTSDKPAKKVVIEDFLFENGQINVSITLAGGKQLTVPLPPIHLEDIGKESDGASVTEVISEVMGAITGAVGDAVAASADVVGDLAGDAAEAAGAAAGAAADAAGDAAGAATDAVKDVGGAAADAAKGAAEGLKKLGGGLFNRD